MYFITSDIDATCNEATTFRVFHATINRVKKNPLVHRDMTPSLWHQSHQHLLNKHAPCYHTFITRRTSHLFTGCGRALLDQLVE